LLIGLLDDLHAEVFHAAACALGRLGRSEGRPALFRLLDAAPSAEVIAAAAAIADADCIVRLGRIARTRPDLEDAAVAALRDIDDPRAAAVLATLGRPGKAKEGQGSALDPPRAERPLEPIT